MKLISESIRHFMLSIVRPSAIERQVFLEARAESARNHAIEARTHCDETACRLRTDHASEESLRFKDRSSSDSKFALTCRASASKDSESSS